MRNSISFNQTASDMKFFNKNSKENNIKHQNAND